jgi:hypothetical protein
MELAVLAEVPAMMTGLAVGGTLLLELIYDT